MKNVVSVFSVERACFGRFQFSNKRYILTYSTYVVSVRRVCHLISLDGTQQKNRCSQMLLFHVVKRAPQSITKTFTRKKVPLILVNSLKDYPTQLHENFTSTFLIYTDWSDTCPSPHTQNGRSFSRIWCFRELVNLNRAILALREHKLRRRQISSYKHPSLANRLFVYKSQF